MPDTVIRTEGLTKRYGTTVAVDHLDLEVRRGEVFGLLGPNGAGKTTTVLMLLGLSEPTEGRAEVLGLDPTRQALEVKRRVGYLPDSVGFYGNLTGRQNLRYIAQLNGLDADEAERRIDHLLEQVGLVDAADQRTDTYSRGMLQRLGIADALIKEPEVLILDEPTIAIDPAGVEEILQLIETLRDEHGVTVLLSSHLLHQVQRICDRVGIFTAGRLVAVGTIEELASRLTGGRQTFEVGVAAEPELAEVVLASLDGVEAVRRDGDLLEITARRDLSADIAPALAARGLVVTYLRRRSGELDEIYRRYFAEAGDGR